MDCNLVEEVGLPASSFYLVGVLAGKQVELFYVSIAKARKFYIDAAYAAFV